MYDSLGLLSLDQQQTVNHWRNDIICLWTFWNQNLSNPLCKLVDIDKHVIYYGLCGECDVILKASAGVSFGDSLWVTQQNYRYQTSGKFLKTQTILRPKLLSALLLASLMVNVAQALEE